MCSWKHQQMSNDGDDMNMMKKKFHQTVQYDVVQEGVNTKESSFNCQGFL